MCTGTSDWNYGESFLWGDPYNQTVRLFHHAVICSSNIGPLVRDITSDHLRCTSAKVGSRVNRLWNRNCGA